MTGDSAGLGGNSPTRALLDAIMESVPVRPQWVKIASPLVGELWTVRTRSIKDLRNDPHDPIPELVRMAEELFRIPQAKPKKEKVFAVLTATLPFLGSVEERRAVQRLFDLTLSGGPTPLRVRHKAAASELASDGSRPVSRETFTDNRERGGRYEKNLISAVADIIGAFDRHLGFSRSRLRPKFHARYPWKESQTPYVERPSLERQLNQAIQGKRRVILLVGDKAVGKSRLAQEVCRQHAQGDLRQIILLQYKQVSGVASMPDLRDIRTNLWDRGVDPDGPSGDSVTAKFAMMLAGEVAPRFIVLDGVTDYDEVDALILPEVRSTVIITSTIEADGVFAITVPPMEDGEAGRLVRSVLFDVSDAEAGKIAAAAGNRPGIIEELCGLFANSISMTAECIKRNLEADPKTLFELAEPSWQRRLTTHYSLTLDTLRAEHPTSALLLEILCLCRSDHLETWSLQRIIGDMLNISEDSFRAAVCDEMLSRLQDYSLVARDEKQGSVHLNALTKLILRNYLGNRAKVILEQLSRVIDEGLRDASSRKDPDVFDRWMRARACFASGEQQWWENMRRYPDPRPGTDLSSNLAKALPDYYWVNKYSASIQLLFADLQAANLAAIRNSSMKSEEDY